MTLQESTLPKVAANELKKQIESEQGNSGQVELQATSSGRVKSIFLLCTAWLNHNIVARSECSSYWFFLCFVIISLEHYFTPNTIFKDGQQQIVAV